MTGLILRSIAILILVLAAAALGVEYSSTSWPTTEGTIVSSGWSRENAILPGEKGEFQVRYEYTVDGKRHLGNRLSYAGNISIVRVVHAAVDNSTNVERSPHPDDTVHVYYAPWWPAISTLVPGAGRMDWIYGVVALLAAIALFAFAHLSKEPVV